MTTPRPIPGPPQAHPMRRFLNFWFAPADPTVLGFIRVVAGCLVLYTHLAYTPDLKNFFGADAWYDLATADRERREVPSVAPSFQWDDPLRPARAPQMPEYPHRRAAVFEYLKLVVADGPAAADARLAYLDRFLHLDDAHQRQFVVPGPHVLNALAYADKLAVDPTDRAAQLAVLVDESLREAKKKSRIPELPIPDALPAVVNLPPAEKKTIAAEAEAFAATLPTTPLAREYVVTHYVEQDHAQRAVFLALARRLAALDPAERDRQLDYFRYWNVDPAIATHTGAPVFSIWFHVTDPVGMQVAHAACLVVFLLFTLGICTRVTSVLTWVAAASYLHRSMHILFGMDTMMNIVLFYLMIGDCGAALSVDRVVRRYRAARRSIAAHGHLDSATRAYLAAPPASVTAGFAIRLIQVHFCFIYLASGMSKLKGNNWWNANAYWDTVANPEFTGIYYRWYESALRWLVSTRAVYGVISAVCVGFTFLCELGVPFLVWTRLRPLAVCMSICLHMGIAAFMGLIVFSLFMMTLVLAYLPGAAIRAVLFGHPASAERVRVRFAPNVDRQRRAAALVAAFDLDGRVDLSTGPDTGSLVVETADGAKTGAGALKVLTAGVPTLKFLRWALLVPAVGRAFTGELAAAAPRPVAKVPAAR